MCEELEDFVFKVINFEVCNLIICRFVSLQCEFGDVIFKIIVDICVELECEGFEVDVYGCVKKFFSIWCKMQEKQLFFLWLFDIYGFCIIIWIEVDCYCMLGVIYYCWCVVLGWFKDYISQFKVNGYCLIYIMVLGCDGKCVEVQICICQMYEVVEFGVVVYWVYCDGVCMQNFFVVDFGEWIVSLIECFGEEDYDEFLEYVKMEMYFDQVFCFLFKGDVMLLLKGVMFIDFVYVIYIWLGNFCVGVKIDGICVLLWMWLKNGQLVEIIVVLGQWLQLIWLDIVVIGCVKVVIWCSLW